MRKIQMSQIAPMNIHYVLYPLEYFLDSLVKFDIQSVELWGGAPHILNQIRAVVGS
jgi:fructoselysine 3-epimerase